MRFVNAVLTPHPLQTILSPPKKSILKVPSDEALPSGAPTAWPRGLRCCRRLWCPLRSSCAATASPPTKRHLGEEITVWVLIVCYCLIDFFDMFCLVCVWVIVWFLLFVSSCRHPNLPPCHRRRFSHRCKSTQMSLWSMGEVRSLEEQHGGGNLVAQETFLAELRDSERPKEGGEKNAGGFFWGGHGWDLIILIFFLEIWLWRKHVARSLSIKKCIDFEITVVVPCWKDGWNPFL